MRPTGCQSLPVTFLFQSTHPKIRMRLFGVLLSLCSRYVNPRIRRSGCDMDPHHFMGLDWGISIHASEDPDATPNFMVANYGSQISIHASEDPDATANNGLIKPLQKFTAKTKCFKFTKVSPNKIST